MDNQIVMKFIQPLSVDTIDRKEVVLNERSAVSTDDRHCVSDAIGNRHWSVSLSFGYKKAPQCHNTVGQRKQMVLSAIDSMPLRITAILNCKLTDRSSFTQEVHQ